MSLLTEHSDGYSIPIVISSKDPFSSDNHNMYRLIIIKSGSGIVSINNTSYVFMAPSILCLSESDVIFLEKEKSINADAIYFLPITIDDDFTIDNINNNIEKLQELHTRNFFLLSPFLYRANSFKGIMNIGYGAIRRLTNLSTALKDETTSFRNFWPCRSRSFFLEMLFVIQYLYTDYEKESTVPLISASSELNEIILHLHTNYNNKITLNKLARKFNINRTTLSQKFLAETGYTIKKYLINIRMKFASTMLKDTLLPISEISYRVGFNDTTHFTRTFKKHLGILPSKYREKMLQVYEQ